MQDHGPAAFQETVSQIDAGAPPEGIVTFIFDLLHHDGDDLLDTPLEERAARLERVAPQLRIPSMLTSDPDTAQRVLDERSARATRASSSRTSPPSTTPAAAARRGARSSRCGPTTSSCSAPSGATAAARAGSRTSTSVPATRARANSSWSARRFKGLTDELLEWQTTELLARETAREGIAVLVRPELVVEIALDGVQSSTRYPAASRCASPGSSATGPTSAPRRRTRSTTCASCSARPRDETRAPLRL